MHRGPLSPQRGWRDFASDAATTGLVAQTQVPDESQLVVKGLVPTPPRHRLEAAQQVVPRQAVEIAGQAEQPRYGRRVILEEGVVEFAAHPGHAAVITLEAARRGDNVADNRVGTVRDALSRRQCSLQQIDVVPRAALRPEVAAVLPITAQRG